MNLILFAIGLDFPLVISENWPVNVFYNHQETLTTKTTQGDLYDLFIFKNDINPVHIGYFQFPMY